MAVLEDKCACRIVLGLTISEDTIARCDWCLNRDTRLAELEQENNHLRQENANLRAANRTLTQMVET